MKMLLTYCILGLLLFTGCLQEVFYDCVDPDYYFLDTETRNWKTYGKGDIIRLANSNSDTIDVVCYFKNHKVEEIDRGSCPSDFNEIIKMHFQIRDQRNSIVYSHEKRFNYSCENLDVFLHSDQMRRNNQDISIEFIAEIDVNGNSFKDVFHVRSPSQPISEFIFSTQSGIIGLELSTVDYFIY